jgi:hypothetical protein
MRLAPWRPRQAGRLYLTVEVVIAIVPVVIATWRVQALQRTKCCGAVYHWLAEWLGKVVALHLRRRRRGRSAAQRVAGRKWSVVHPSGTLYVVSIQRVRLHLLPRRRAPRLATLRGNRSLSPPLVPYLRHSSSCSSSFAIWIPTLPSPLVTRSASPWSHVRSTA